MQGRLNSFQRSMLQWDEIHPYNAIHVAQVRGTLDPGRLTDCIRRTLAQMGLTRLTLDRQRRRFRYEGGPAPCEVRILKDEGGPQRTLAAEMERQLNARFDASQPFNPFRFFVVPAEGSFHLGLVYFHPAADAESVVGLLLDIVLGYLDPETGAARGRTFLDPAEVACRLRPRVTAVARKILSLPAQMRNLRQSCRVRADGSGDQANGLTCFTLGPEELGALVTLSKDWGVTVNDLLMALLLKALAPCASGRVQARRRRKLSLGCIVNSRDDLGMDSRRVFGLFLGAFTVTHEMPAGLPLRTLAGDVRQQTSSIKQRKLYLATPLELGLVRFVMKFFPPDRRAGLYAKHYPLWGGVTNMNLNSRGELPGIPALLDYFRGVSTGPIVPLVLSATTMGDRLNIGLSYRTAVFDRSEVEDLERRIREHLQEARREA